MREIEIKLRTPDLEAVVRKLETLGCSISVPIVQNDINFIHKDDEKWFESTIRGFVYPRLRMQEGQPLTFTVKQPIKNESDCREHELHVDDADELRGMMEMLGFKEGMQVNKTRRTATFGEYTITLDEVEKLGNFIEIERVVEDGDPEKIQEEMLAFAEKNFNISRDTLVLKGYDILMHEMNSGIV